MDENTSDATIEQAVNALYADRKQIDIIEKAQMAIAFGGWLALFMQGSMPDAAIAFYKKSPFLTDPAGVLQNIVTGLETWWLGTPQEMLAAANATHRRHGRVHGTVDTNDEKLPPDTQFNALDPKLQMWIMTSLVHCFIRGYETFVRKLTPAEKDKFVSEYKNMAGIVGIPDGAWHLSFQDMEKYIQNLYSHYGDTAYGATEGWDQYLYASPERAALVVPVVLNAFNSKLGWRAPMSRFLLKGLMPDFMRKWYGLRWSPLHQIGYIPLVALFRGMTHAALHVDAFGAKVDAVLAQVPVVRRAVPALQAFRFKVLNETLNLVGPIYYRPGMWTNC